MNCFLIFALSVTGRGLKSFEARTSCTNLATNYEPDQATANRMLAENNFYKYHIGYDDDIQRSYIE